MNEFDIKIREIVAEGLLSEEISTLQINLGRTCTLACSHCHLACSPRRSEQMPDHVMETLLSLTGRKDFCRIDITGGAPELHPGFRHLVKSLIAQKHNIQVRTNLTTLLAPSGADLIDLFTSCGINLVASLPCYEEENVDAQRGRGVHARSIAALRLLNQAGYGREDGMTLNLAYNPGGPCLPPDQSALEEIYRRELKKRYDLSFHHLLVMTNMPLGRFRRQLEQRGELEAYLSRLKSAFNPETLVHLMCRHQISVDWDGTIYDCDFNLALGMPVNHGAPHRLDTLDWSRLAPRKIMTDNHCFGCTAGAGSSCAGMLAGTD